MDKILLIVNPCSGTKKARRYLIDIIEILNKADCAVTVFVTSAPGDGERAVLRQGRDADRIVCCGGDGTFHEVVSGLLKSGLQIPLGYIPAGSTNDFATSLKLSMDMRKAAAVAATESPVPVDIGLFGNRYFCYVASFGLFTQTSYETPQNMKNTIGHAAYLLHGIQELSQLKSYPLKFTLQDKTELSGDFIFGAISNTTSVGGVLTLKDELVDMSDGSLELLLIRKPNNLTELHECVRALQQKTYRCNMITLVSTAAVTVQAPKDMPWTLDGEKEAGHRTVEVQCIHHGIQVVR